MWEVDNSTVNFTNWAKRQPDNWNDSEDCVVVGAEKYFGLWKDQKCDRWFLYICERPASGKQKKMIFKTKKIAIASSGNRLTRIRFGLLSYK